MYANASKDVVDHGADLTGYIEALTTRMSILEQTLGVQTTQLGVFENKIDSLNKDIAKTEESHKREIDKVDKEAKKMEDIHKREIKNLDAQYKQRIADKDVLIKTLQEDLKS